MAALAPVPPEPTTLEDGRTRYVIYIDMLPPSLNRLAHAHWTTFRRHKLAWQQDIGTLLLAAKVPKGCAHIAVTFTLTVPTRARRDVDNFSALLHKACGDALVRGRHLDDDTPDYITMAPVVFRHVAGRSRTTITLDVTPEPR